MVEGKVPVVAPVYRDTGRNCAAHREQDIRRSIAERQSCIYRKEIVMLKKVVYGIVAGSLVFAAQAALAGGTQYWSEKHQRWQSVSSLPFDAFTKEGVAGRPGIASEAGPKGEPGMSKAGAPQTSFPQPYDRDGRYFN